MAPSILLLLVSLVATSAFRGVFLSRKAPTQRFMADDAAFDAIRAKMQSDPNYNPMTDPQAQQVCVI